MAEKHITGVSFFQEESVEKGGAAVMQMVLGCPTVGLSPIPSQTDLYNYAITQNDTSEPAGTWDIDPQGLARALIHYKPASFTNTFVNYNFPGAPAANQKIIFTIETYNVPPAVVVQTGLQWLAVVGYKTNTAGELVSMFINDPRPPISDGTGDPPDFEVGATSWNQDYYFSRISRGTRWLNQYAGVYDPKPPEGEVQTMRETPRADGKRILDADTAIRLSRELLDERGSLTRELFARALREGRPAEAHLVQMLDKADQFYYLVRYQINNEDIAVVALDARYGTFMEAIAYRRPLRFFRVTAKEVPKLLVERGVQLHEPIEDVRDRILSRLVGELFEGKPLRHEAAWDPLRVRAYLDAELMRSRQPMTVRRFRLEEIDVHRLLVWRSTEESLSPLYPFYQVNTPQEQLYVRAADAFIYPRLKGLFWQRLGG